MKYNEQETGCIIEVLVKCKAAPQFFTHPSQKGKFIWLNNPPEGRIAEIRKAAKSADVFDGRVWAFHKGTDSAYMIQCVDGIVFLVCIDKFGNAVPDMRFAFTEPAIAGSVDMLP